MPAFYNDSGFMNALLCVEKALDALTRLGSSEDVLSLPDKPAMRRGPTLAQPGGT